MLKVYLNDHVCWRNIQLKRRRFIDRGAIEMPRIGETVLIFPRTPFGNPPSRGPSPSIGSITGLATRLEIYFLASEAPRQGVSSLSPDNVFAAEVSACCNASKLRAGRALNRYNAWAAITIAGQGGGLSHPPSDVTHGG